MLPTHDMDRDVSCLRLFKIGKSAKRIHRHTTRLECCRGKANIEIIEEKSRIKCKKDIYIFLYYIKYKLYKIKYKVETAESEEHKD